MNTQTPEISSSQVPMHQALLAIMSMVFGLFAIMLLFIAVFHGFAF